MKRQVGFLALALALQACHRAYEAPPQSYRSWKDQWIVRLGLPGLGIGPCKNTAEYDECYKMQPVQRWRGVWLTQFEDERFCPGRTQTCAADGQPWNELWFNTRTFTSRPQIRAKGNRKYAFEFVGRRTKYPVAGIHHYVIVVDRLISMKDLGPLPGLPQDED
jgi:hypothetical protein